MNSPSDGMKLKMMITILNRGKSELLRDFFAQEHLYFHYVHLGRGTATSEMMDYFGLGDMDKDVVVSFVPQCMLKDVRKTVIDKMHLEKSGHGILFTLPLSSISAAFQKVSEKCVEPKEDEGESSMEISIKNDLILTAVNAGFTDIVMDAARAAGATGGTVLHARSLNHEEAEPFLGISIQPEKEIVAILVKREEKSKIMQAIHKVAGLESECKGILLSLPVEDVVGLGK